MLQMTNISGPNIVALSLYNFFAKFTVLFLIRLVKFNFFNDDYVLKETKKVWFSLRGDSSQFLSFIKVILISTSFKL